MPKPEFIHPTEPFLLNQGWGTYNPGTYAQFGFTRHNGLDMVLPADKRIVSPCNGTVVRVATKENGLWQPNGGGVFVGIMSELMEFSPFSNTTPENVVIPFVGGVYRTLIDLLHLESILVSEGNIVRARQVVAIGDNTGVTTGTHCHSQWRRVKWMGGATYETIDKNDANNSFDPTPFFIDSGHGYVFTRDLSIGSIGDDVRALQQYLNTHGYKIALAGPGSPGNETDYFGELTQMALKKLQIINSITPSSGYFGHITREFVMAHA